MNDEEYQKILNTAAVKLSEHFESVVILATVESDKGVAMVRSRNGNVITCLGHLNLAVEDLKLELTSIDFDEED
jgi:hypothetical protein